MTGLPSEKQISFGEFLSSRAIYGRVVGLGLFGSVAKHEATEYSDIDVLELRTDIYGRSVQKIQSQRGLVDIQIWPLWEFARLLCGESSSAYYDAFKFDVLRTTEILYDPDGLLSRMKAFATANSLPHSLQSELLASSRATLRTAKALLEKNLLCESQIILRRAADDFARSVLLASDVASINPSRAFLGSLKSIDEDLLGLLLDLYGVDKADPCSATRLVRDVSACIDDLTRRPKYGALSSRNALLASLATNEIRDAYGDLHRGDFPAASVQARRAAALIDHYHDGRRADSSVRNGIQNGSSQALRVENARRDLLGLSDNTQQLEKTLDRLACLMDAHSHGILVPRRGNE